MKTLFLGVGIVVVSLWSATPVHACECLASNPCETVARSGAVFSGIAVDVTQESTESVSTTKGVERKHVLRETVARFQIQKILKGLPLDQKIVDIRTGLNCADSGVRSRTPAERTSAIHRSVRRTRGTSPKILEGLRAGKLEARMRRRVRASTPQRHAPFTGTAE